MTYLYRGESSFVCLPTKNSSGDISFAFVFESVEIAVVTAASSKAIPLSIDSALIT